MQNSINKQYERLTKELTTAKLQYAIVTLIVIAITGVVEFTVRNFIPSLIAILVMSFVVETYVARVSKLKSKLAILPIPNDTEDHLDDLYDDSDDYYDDDDGYESNCKVISFETNARSTIRSREDKSQEERRKKMKAFMGSIDSILDPDLMTDEQKRELNIPIADDVSDNEKEIKLVELIKANANNDTSIVISLDDDIDNVPVARVIIENKISSVRRIAEDVERLGKEYRYAMDAETYADRIVQMLFIEESVKGLCFELKNSRFYDEAIHSLKRLQYLMSYTDPYLEEKVHELKLYQERFAYYKREYGLEYAQTDYDLT